MCTYIYIYIIYIYREKWDRNSLLQLAKEERLQQGAWTIEKMRTKLAEWSGNMTQFNKQKNKEDKKAYLLDTWYESFVLPEVVSGEEKKGKCKQIEDALKFKAEVCTEKIAETPESLAKILLFKQEWLDKVMEGVKTLELRKSVVDHDDHMYLAVKDTIYARCKIGKAVQISNLAEFEKLAPAHKCAEPPYSFPFYGHTLQKVQHLEPIQYKKLPSAIGRALFRPLAEPQAEGSATTAAAEAPTEEASDEKPAFFKLMKPTAKAAPKPSSASTHEAGSDEKPMPKKGKTAAAKKKAADSKDCTEKKEKKGVAAAKAKSKSTSMRLPKGDVLEGQTVSVVNPQGHFKPSKDRLQHKKEFLKRKEAVIMLNISGGILSHMNNHAFSQPSSSTLGFLTGSADDKGIVTMKSIWIPDVERDQPIHSKTFLDEELKAFCDKHSELVVGCLIVKTAGEATLCEEDLNFACDHQKDCNEHFVTALTGKNKMTKFFRITAQGLEAHEKGLSVADHVKELHASVLWTGPLSLYRACILRDERTQKELIAEAARKDLERQQPDKKKKLRQRKATTDKGICHTAKVVQGYQATAEALGSIAAFLTENLTDFSPDNLTIEDRFAHCIEQFPEARDELYKVTPEQCPRDVREAAHLLTTVHNLKTILEVKAAKRVASKNHTYDGQKYKKSSEKKRGKGEDDLFQTPPAKRPRRSPGSTDSMLDPTSTASASASSTTPTASTSISSLPKAAEEEDSEGIRPAAAVSRFQNLLTAPFHNYWGLFDDVYIYIYIYIKNLLDALGF